jgi:YHS domain-containing protein
MKNYRAFLLIIALSLFTLYAAYADAPVVNKDKSGVALKGYDPVAYFTEKKAVQGNKEFEHVWMDSTWRFSSPSNRDLFAANPEKYAPQFGGYCAWGVTQGYLAPIDPKAWKVVDDKLYLNYDTKVQAEWKQDIPGNIKKALDRWPEASKTKPLE